MLPTIEYAISHGDILTFDADVIALKYAQAFYGADEALARALGEAGVARFALRPDVGEYKFVETLGCAHAAHALFVGVPRLSMFGYPQIRHFAAVVLRGIDQYAPEATHLCMTIHGVGYGLDETEACLAQLEGCLDAIRSTQAHGFLSNLRRISVVDKNAARVDRLRQTIDQYLLSGRGPTRASKGAQDGVYLFDTAHHSGSVAADVSTAERGGAGSSQRPHVFVAMPFNMEMNDTFFYGIEGPVHSAGFLCERMDHISFTGEIIEWMKLKIESASLVIAEMSGANPNVYLEVGYAWGKGRNTLLLAKDGVNLEFDARGHRCIFYSGIKDLEEKIKREMAELKTQNLI